jgi:hypothetical protein
MSNQQILKDKYKKYKQKYLSLKDITESTSSISSLDFEKIIDTSEIPQDIEEQRDLLLSLDIVKSIKKILLNPKLLVAQLTEDLREQKELFDSDNAEIFDNLINFLSNQKFLTGSVACKECWSQKNIYDLLNLIPKIPELEEAGIDLISEYNKVLNSDPDELDRQAVNFMNSELARFIPGLENLFEGNDSNEYEKIEEIEEIEEIDELDKLRGGNPSNRRKFMGKMHTTYKKDIGRKKREGRLGPIARDLHSSLFSASTNNKGSSASGTAQIVMLLAGVSCMEMPSITSTLDEIYSFDGTLNYPSLKDSIKLVDKKIKKQTELIPIIQKFPDELIEQAKNFGISTIDTIANITEKIDGEKQYNDMRDSLLNLLSKFSNKITSSIDELKGKNLIEIFEITKTVLNDISHQMQKDANYLQDSIIGKPKTIGSAILLNVIHNYFQKHAKLIVECYLYIRKYAPTILNNLFFTYMHILFSIIIPLILFNSCIKYIPSFSLIANTSIGSLIKYFISEKTFNNFIGSKIASFCVKPTYKLITDYIYGDKYTNEFIVEGVFDKSLIIFGYEAELLSVAANNLSNIFWFLWADKFLNNFMKNPNKILETYSKKDIFSKLNSINPERFSYYKLKERKVLYELLVKDSALIEYLKINDYSIDLLLEILNR